MIDIDYDKRRVVTDKVMYCKYCNRVIKKEENMYYCDVKKVFICFKCDMDWRKPQICSAITKKMPEHQHWLMRLE